LQVLLDEAFVRCELPNKPDYAKAEEILMDILKAELA